MNKTLSLFLMMVLLTLQACTPQAAATPSPSPATAFPTPVETQTSVVVATTAPEPSANWKQYTNSTFGLSFQYPASWYGPDEYISEQTLRVAVGSDVVYPYGEPPEQPSEVGNSYDVIIQFSRNNQNLYRNDTYQLLAGLQDGESFSDARSMIIRVRQLEFGRYKGFEYISTLSETAQPQPVYGREVILVDDQSNVLTIFGTPDNVEVSDGASWRDVYRMIDEENLTIFHEIVDSITIE